MTSMVIGEFSISTENKQFYFDVIRGLTQQPKQLASKYFYDKKGDSLFQAIMASPDYYLTNSEMEIFACQSDSIADYILGEGSDFELVELGPGNCAKSIHLLEALAATNVSFDYLPIDISENVMSQLESFLPWKIPGLDFNGLIGANFEALREPTKNHRTM